MARRVPGHASITLAVATTKYNLLTLLRAATFAALPRKAQTVVIQVDLEAGAAKVYIGDPDNVSATACGWDGVATQVYHIEGFTNNLINMDDIGLTSDGTNVQINVTWVTR